MSDNMESRSFPIGWLDHNTDLWVGRGLILQGKEEQGWTVGTGDKRERLEIRRTFLQRLGSLTGENLGIFWDPVIASEGRVLKLFKKKF